MDRPTKTGTYWFRGKHTNYIGMKDQVFNGPVFVDFYNHGNDPNYVGSVSILGWSGSEPLSDWEGEWQEITEEMIFGDKKTFGGGQ